MAAVEESVGLYDENGLCVGQAPRSVVRRDNLRHAATGVIVRDSSGRIYVHRRTDTKDVYPGLHDCCAGGIVAAGEDPREAASRELAEELGISATTLEPIATQSYADEHTNYVAFVFATTYDGPITWQPEEVADGQWMSLEELDSRLADPDWPFVPDSRELVGPWIREQLGRTDK